jgi:hypothetical protein
MKMIHGLKKASPHRDLCQQLVFPMLWPSLTCMVHHSNHTFCTCGFVLKRLSCFKYNARNYIALEGKVDIKGR